MRVVIIKKDDTILTQKEYFPIPDRGEIAHFIAELETIKQELLQLWKESIEKEE